MTATDAQPLWARLRLCRILQVANRPGSLPIAAAVAIFLAGLPGILLAEALSTGEIAAETHASAATDGDALMSEGASHFRSGNFIEARATWESAAASYASGGASHAQIAALLRSGEASLALGERTRAVQTFEATWELAQSVATPSQEAAAASALGNAYALVGRKEEARALLQSGAELAARSGSLDAAAAASNNLGNLLATQGELSAAEAAFASALQAATNAQNNALSSRASANLARTLVEQGRYPAAADRLAESTRHLGPLPASHQKAYSLISAGRLYGKLADADSASRSEWRQRAARLLEEAAALAGQIGDWRAKSYAAGYLGALDEQAGRYPQAMRHTQDAILAAQRAGADEALYRWQWQTGRLLRAQGDLRTAVLAYKHAVYTLESIRQDLNADLRAGGTSFRDSVGPVYFQLADLLLLEAARDTDPRRAAQNLVDARETVELIKGAELEDYFQDDCVTAFKARSVGIEQVGERTAIVYPILLEERTELLLTLPSGLRQFTAKVGKAALTEEIRALRSKLEKRTTHEYYPHSRQIYEWLFRPIEEELERQQINTVVVIPDGPLRTIPIAALHDGQQFLVERYALATTPGLTLTDPAPIERQQIDVLLNGLSASVQGFPSLPNVDEELLDIQALYGGTVLKNQDFVVANVEQALANQPYSIVHIASHGQFSSDVENTFLLTYDGRIDMNELETLVSSTKFRDDPVELLTLSACETAAGDDRAALGLAGVAVKAGARSALATLWTVNDPAAAALLSVFYGRLRDPAVTKAQALREAQLQLARDRRYWHPSYWSPFLLIGNWL